MERHRRDADPRGADRATLRAAARPLTGAAEDYDARLAFIGDARFVLLGEASHGTHDVYRERARITQRLIQGRARRLLRLAEAPRRRKGS